MSRMQTSALLMHACYLIGDLPFPSYRPPRSPRLDKQERTKSKKPHQKLSCSSMASFSCGPRIASMWDYRIFVDVTIAGRPTTCYAIATCGFCSVHRRQFGQATLSGYFPRTTTLFPGSTTPATCKKYTEFFMSSYVIFFPFFSSVIFYPLASTHRSKSKR